jgi:thermitase
MILAIDNGADVLSMSLGGPSTDAAQVAYKAVVEYAAKKGVIIVAAAGNEDTDASKKVPASVVGVISVAATNEENKKANFSNDVSKLKWAIAAPGVNIFSTTPGSRYDFMSGTSMATPYVAGLLGLMKSLDPTLSPEKAFNILNESGLVSKSGKSTGKIIQPLSAVALLFNE